MKATQLVSLVLLLGCCSTFAQNAPTAPKRRVHIEANITDLNIEDLNDIHIDVPNSPACDGSSSGAKTITSRFTATGCRGTAFLVDYFYDGACSGQTTNTDFFYAVLTAQDGTFYGDTNANFSIDTNHPCHVPSTTLTHRLDTIHGLDTVDLVYSTDGAWNQDLYADFFDAEVLDAYDDHGDIIFDVETLPADGKSTAHAQVTNLKAYPDDVRVWSISGGSADVVGTNEVNLGCSIDPITGEITAGMISGTISVRASASNMDCWIEEDFQIGCAGCAQGCTSETAENESVLIEINTGNTAFGKSAGHLRIDEKFPSAALSTPATLKYFTGNLTAQDVLVTYANGVIQNIFAPQISASVVSNTPYQYQILFYTNSTLSGPPVTTWTIANPDGASSINRFFATKIEGGLTTEYDYVWDPAAQGWNLISQGGNRKEQRYSVSNGTQRTEYHVIRDGSDSIKFQEVKVFQTFAWGEELIQHTVGSGSNALQTTWTFYTDPNNTTNYSRLYQVVSPGNHWERYAYDSKGRVARKVTQYLDSPLPTSVAQENTNRVTLYANSVLIPDGGSFDVADEQHSYLFGYETAGTLKIFSPVDGRTDIYRAQGPGGLGNGNYLIETSWKYLTGPFAGEPQVVWAEDNTWTFFFYAYSADGNFRTNIVKKGAPNNSLTDIVDGTSAVTVLNKSGNVVSQRTYDVASGLLTGSATTLAFDERSRPTVVQYLDGTTETTVYGCCGVDSFTDREGTVTTYNYDPYSKQIADVTRAGITTHSEYDAAGNLVRTTRIGTDNSQIVQNVSAYDDAGRLISSTAPANGSGQNRTTLYTEYFDSSNHRVQTTTFPDSSTRIETSYPDGSLLSITGTAAHPLRYQYSLSIASSFYGETSREIKVGSNGEQTEWTQSYRDALGRTYATVFSAAPGQNNAFTYSFFNLSGQLIEQVDPDGVQTLYAYNNKGELVYTALDVDRNGLINLNGIDRISYVTNDVLIDNATVVRRTQSFTWKSNNANTSTPVSMTESSVDGLRTWSTLFNNGQSITSRSITAHTGNGARLVTNIAPDNSSSIAAYQDGYLLSVISKDSGGQRLSAITYSYDRHGRQSAVTDARNGTMHFTFNDADQVTSIAAPSADGIQPSQVTSNFFDSMNRVWKTTLSDNTSVTNDFFPTGEIQQTSGSRTYPVEYTYDSQGRMKTMTTWKDFANDAGAAVTTWNYDPYRGFLLNKVYDGGNAGPSYTYTPAGRLRTRTWARGITTTYSYNNAGDASSVVYNDGTTAPISYGYDRLGRQTSVTNGATICAFRYNDVGQALSESYTGGPLNGITVTNDFDPLLRRTALTLNSQLSTLNQVTYGYDNASRLQTVANGQSVVTCAYVSNSPLVGGITFQQNGATRLTTTKSYDYLNRLTSISSVSSAGFVSSFNYAYNKANQRTAVTNSDNSRWIYKYDALGQVISGRKYWADGTPVAGDQFEYGFDDIGNRITTKSGGDNSGANLHVADYSANNLNQYISRTVPGLIAMSGSANSNATISLWGSDGSYAATSRKGDYYHGELPVTNDDDAVFLAVTNLAVLNNGNNPDVITNTSGNVFVPQTPEIFGYDADGNMTNDGRWTMTWDGENRLISMTSLAGNPDASKLKLDFSYDYYGRRIQKIVSAWNSSTFSYQPTKTNRFAYDGWNLLAVLDGQSTPLQSFTWGLDLSGTEQGAGGVGGLLSVIDKTNGTHVACFDCNGNVMALVSASDGGTSGKYEYGPFGEPTRISGAVALCNSFRFSTKYQDEQDGFLYYGLRYYVSQPGRWLSRDPLGEDFSVNVQEFSENNPIGAIDDTGLGVIYTLNADGSQSMTYTPTASPPRGLQNQLSSLWNGNGAVKPKKKDDCGCCEKLKILLMQAYLADDVYNDNDGEEHVPGAPNFQRLSNIQLNKLGIDSNLLIDNQSSFYSALYFNRLDSKYTYALRGTKEGKDWMTDLKQAAGLPEKQYQEAARAGALLGSMFPGKICGVGHSLGSGLDTVAALSGNYPGVNFNPASVSPLTARRLGLPIDPILESHTVGNIPYVPGLTLNLQNASQLIKNYSVPGDVLSRFVNRAGWAPKTDGQQFILHSPGTLPLGVNRHFMSNVIAAIQREMAEHGCE
jgi:RHS repeat-associated protein